MTTDEPRSLAPRDPTVTPDAYEREYMKGEGLVLYRTKQRAPWVLTGVMGAVSLVSVIPVILGMPGAWIAAAISLPIFFVLWVLFAVLRVTVSEGHVKVQYGLFGPTIPIGAIESVEPTTYRWARYGGWGIRLGPDGEWLYNMPGDGGKAVRIVWRDAKGRRRITLIGSHEPATLAESIERARRALPAGPTHEALPPGG